MIIDWRLLLYMRNVHACMEGSKLQVKDGKGCSLVGVVRRLAGTELIVGGIMFRGRPFAMSLRTLVSMALLELELLVFVVTLLLTGFANLVLSRGQTIRPFYPHDATLWYSYNGDSITTEFLFFVYYFVVSPVLYALKLRELQKKKHLTKTQRRVIAARMAFGLWNATMVGILVVELLKGYVGRLRPSFAEACLASKAPYSDDILSRIFFTDQDCPSHDQQALHDMRRSFPSGHASLALGGGVYIQLCLIALAQGVNEQLMSIALYLLGCVFGAFGFAVGASRVVDAAHHVGDVAVGSLIGVWAAVAQFWHVQARSALLQREGERAPTEQATEKGE